MAPTPMSPLHGMLTGTVPTRKDNPGRRAGDGVAGFGSVDVIATNTMRRKIARRGARLKSRPVSVPPHRVQS